MRFYPLKLLAILLFSYNLLLAMVSTAWGKDKTYGSAIAEVVKVHDGDSITVTISSWPPIVGEEIDVRVNGIDTRELSKGGKAARDFVRRLLPIGSKVRLSGIGRDKYFRLLANVGYQCINLESNDPSCRDLSITLLNNKYAIPYNGGTKQPFPKDIK